MEKYFTQDNFKIEKGIDLSLELQDDDNASNKVKRFIKEVTDKIILYLVRYYNATELMKWDSLSEDRQELFLKGCMEQASYILRNGWVTLDSGINGETGVIVDWSKGKMYDDAMNYFYIAGLANMQCYGNYQPIWKR